jgi:hypothetical protein
LSAESALDKLSGRDSSEGSGEVTADIGERHPAIDRRRQERRRDRAPALRSDRRTKQRRKREANRELRRPVETALGRSVDELERQLSQRIRAHMSRGSLAVTLTDNRYTMISVRREPEQIPQFRVRLHHMFAAAPPHVSRALALYIARNDADASKELGEFIDANQSKVRADDRRNSPSITTAGEVHDLQDIYDDPNHRYFGGAIDATITWGPRSGKPRRRNSIKMGSYSLEDRLIRIHRSLDRRFVPRFFVEWIVYHEMLHQVHDAPIINGRRRFHTKEFLADEAAFDRYDEARTWERENLEALLTY